MEYFLCWLQTERAWPCEILKCTSNFALCPLNMLPPSLELHVYVGSYFLLYPHPKWEPRWETIQANTGSRGREMTHTQMGHAGDSSSCWLNCPNQVKWIHGKLGSGTLCWACKSWRRLLELGESSCLDKGYIQVVPIILFFLIILSNPRLTSVLRLLCHHPESFGLVKSGIQWNYQASRLRHRRQGCRQDNQILLGI